MCLTNGGFELDQKTSFHKRNPDTSKPRWSRSEFLQFLKVQRGDIIIRLVLPKKGMTEWLVARAGVPETSLNPVMVSDAQTVLEQVFLHLRDVESEIQNSEIQTQVHKSGVREEH